MPPPDRDLPPLVAGSGAAGRPARLRDLEFLDETQTGEIIDGRLIVSPRPAPPHAECASALDTLVSGPFRFGRGGPGGWIVVVEPELRLGSNELTDEPHVVVPDLAAWRRERLPERPATAWYPIVPDWICELLSPSTATDDRIEKLPFYARQGVRWAWLVDPVAQSFEGYENASGRWTQIATHRGAAKVRVPPFDAVELDLALVWAH